MPVSFQTTRGFRHPPSRKSLSRRDRSFSVSGVRRELNPGSITMPSSSTWVRGEEPSGCDVYWWATSLPGAGGCAVCPDGHAAAGQRRVSRTTSLLRTCPVRAGGFAGVGRRLPGPPPLPGTRHIRPRGSAVGVVGVIYVTFHVVPCSSCFFPLSEW